MSLLITDNMGKAEASKERFDAECVKLRDLDKQQAKHVSNRRLLETQLTENKMVREELDKLEEGEVVMKLIGPTLLKQDTEEVSINVNKRIEYIENEIKRLESTMESHAKEMDKQRKLVAEISSTLNKA
ncbi:hypothetical protein M3Y97_00211700 [Aphelenchoides bicaudatus]|nr:hypothetical protein M3Y97_00211700 [Aphelenchoides bicaudatus]